MTPTPTSEVTRLCVGTRIDGKPCRAPALSNDDFCFAHSPNRKQEAQAARSRGGKNQARPAPAEPCDLSTLSSQLAEIEATIDRVRAGDEPSSVARLVLYGISLARPLAELVEISKRLDELEGTIETNDKA